MNKKKFKLLIVLGIFFPVAIFMLSNQKKTYKLKAEETTVVSENLLKSNAWGGFYMPNGIVQLVVEKLTSDLQKIYEYGAAKVNQDTVYLQKKTLKISFNEAPIIVRQPIKTKIGRYYQLNAVAESNSNTPNTYKRISSTVRVALGAQIFKSVLVDLDNQGSQEKKVKLSFFAESGEYNVDLDLSHSTYTADKDWVSVQFNHLAVTDITEEVLGLGSEMDALFTNSNQTALKLSTTQKEINKLKERLNDYKDLLSSTEFTRLETKLTKAQGLLDAVQLVLTVENPVNKIEDNHSYTLIGVTYPNAFVNFSGHPSIPEGSLSSEVIGDNRKYQIRADKQGKFSYKLPENQFFSFGQKLTITTSLHGKEKVLVKQVLDTVPPDQPILNRLTDVSTAFTGTAEPEARISVFDEEDRKVLEGFAQADGRYSLALTRNLTPYKKYYVVATDSSGNMSIRSLVHEVADTTPPKADPIKQVLNVGELLPELSTLYTNLYDNAGNDQVTITLTKKPDLSKVGYTTAEITLTDKAQNHSVVSVPFFVKDKQTIDDQKHMLFATDFSVDAIEFPTLAEEQKKYLLKKSNAGLWNMETGENKLSDIIIDDSQLKRAPGSYNVEFHFGNMKKQVKVTLNPGSLAFEKTTSAISYGTPTIRSEKQSVFPESSMEYLIKDTRFQTKNWRLVGQLSKPLQLRNGEVTKTHLSVVKTNSKGQKTKQPLSNQMTTELYDNAKGGNGRFSVSFNEKAAQAIVLDVLPGSVRSNAEYQTEIILTLENGP